MPSSVAFQLMNYADISKSILDLLPGREMTVAKIKAKLGTQLHLSAVFNLMCDQGLLVRIQSGNGWKTKTYKYALFQDDAEVGWSVYVTT